MCLGNKNTTVVSIGFTLGLRLGIAAEETDSDKQDLGLEAQGQKKKK